MEKRANTLTHQISYLLSGRIVAFVLMFFLPVILVRLFPKETFGLYRQFFLVFYALFTILQLGMSVSLPAFIPRNRKHANSIVAATIFLLGGVGLLCMIGGGLVQWMWGNTAGAHPLLNLGLVLGVFTGLMILSSPFEQILLLEEKSGTTAILIIVWDLCRGGFLLFAALWFNDLKAALWMMTFAAVFRAIVMLLYLRKQYQLSFYHISLPLFFKQMQEAGSLTLQAGAHLFEINIDRYLIMFFFTASSFAVYTVGAFQLPIVDMLFSSVCGVLLPKLSGYCAEQKMDELIKLYRDSMRRMLLVLLPLTGLLFVVRHEFIVTLFSASYVESVTIFGVYVWIIPTYAGLSALVLQAIGHRRYLFVSSILKSFLAILIVWTGLYLGEVIGVVVGLVTYHFIATASLIWLTAKALDVPLRRLFPWETSLKSGVLLLVCILLLEWSFSFIALPILLGLIIKPLVFLLLFFPMMLFLNILTVEDKAMFIQLSQPILKKIKPFIQQKPSVEDQSEHLALKGAQQ